ncbi:MAG: hypothetical protein QOH32_3424 [Bradyrhizobium sp.]|jgi:hypothetical protein|nr:hypothetical protein [Bradyrhizobium sp.]
MTARSIEQPVTRAGTNRQKAVHDIWAAATGGAIATAATGIGLWPALGVGVVAGILFAYLERNKLAG